MVAYNHGRPFEDSIYLDDVRVALAKLQSVEILLANIGSGITVHSSRRKDIKNVAISSRRYRCIYKVRTLVCILNRCRS